MEGMSATLVMQTGIRLDGRMVEHVVGQREFAAWTSRHTIQALAYCTFVLDCTLSAHVREPFLAVMRRCIVLKHTQDKRPDGPRPVSTLPHQQASTLKQKDEKRLCRSRNPPREMRFLAQARLPLPSRPKTTAETGLSLMGCNAGCHKPSTELFISYRGLRGRLRIRLINVMVGG